jgi:DNA-binding XRE family transcriptional regulator
MQHNCLRKLRTQRGESIWGLTSRTGVSATTISAIECHGYQPRQSTRERIAAGLGCSVHDVWPEHKKEMSTPT